MIVKSEKSIVIRAEDGAELRITYDNRGEPYRDGIGMGLTDGDKNTSLFLERAEALAIRDVITRIFPVQPDELMIARMILDRQKEVRFADSRLDGDGSMSMMDCKELARRIIAKITGVKLT